MPWCNVNWWPGSPPPHRGTDRTTGQIAGHRVRAEADRVQRAEALASEAVAAASGRFGRASGMVGLARRHPHTTCRGRANEGPRLGLPDKSST